MSITSFLFMFSSSFMALFPVINPIGNSFIVNGFLDGLEDSQRKLAIRKIVANYLLIGVGSLLAGHLLLLLFGLAIPIIQLGGGILICKTAMSLLSDSGGSSDDDDDSKQPVGTLKWHEVQKKIFYPITFPISIGPGSISVIFTLMAAGSVKGKWLETSINYVLIALVLVCMTAILYLFLTQGQKIMQKLGSVGNQIINKLVAFFTFCIGIQIMITGISKIFDIHISF